MDENQSNNKQYSLFHSP